MSECVDREQSRICADKNKCNSSLTKPIVSQSCAEPTSSGEEAGRTEIGKVVESLRLNWKMIAGIGALVLIVAIIIALLVVRKIRQMKAVERIMGR